MPRARLIAIAALLLLATACITTPGNFRARNRGRINVLSIGLARNDVLALMGMGSQSVCLNGPMCLLLPMLYLEKATNPHRIERAETPDGVQLEIYFYQTETRTADTTVTDDELTPLVIEDGRLAGWGWIFLRQNAERYNIRLR